LKGDTIDAAISGDSNFLTNEGLVFKVSDKELLVDRTFSTSFRAMRITTCKAVENLVSIMWHCHPSNRHRAVHVVTKKKADGQPCNPFARTYAFHS
jgi:hypothetical protein